MKVLDTRVTVLCAMLFYVACDDASPEATDSGVAADSGLPESMDASAPDAGPDDDGGVDAGSSMDAGPPDGDGDGVPDDSDCDPADAAVGADAERDCSNACGDGTETCTDGEWAACTAPTDCLCETADEMRVITCGNCGEMAQRCTDGTWMSTSDCLNEGPCAPGETEMMDRGRCGVNQRICQVDCSWGDWAVVVPRGECSPGSRQCDPPTGTDRLCNSMCMWEDDPACAVNP